MVALANASGGGVRFFERMAINASSCASQSTAFWTNTMLSGEFCAYRSLAKSGLPTITSRACVAPAAPGAAAGLSCAARSRGRRLSRRNSREGSRNAVVSWTPPARLVTNSGVTVPFGAFVVSRLLGQGSNTASISALTGDALVLAACTQKG